MSNKDYTFDTEEHEDKELTPGAYLVYKGEEYKKSEAINDIYQAIKDVLQSKSFMHDDKSSIVKKYAAAILILTKSEWYHYEQLEHLEHCNRISWSDVLAMILPFAIIVGITILLFKLGVIL